jgi:hypothetical protein
MDKPSVMITRVRIAEPEQWCPEKRNNAEFRIHPPGTYIEIIPSSMRVNTNCCMGREWQIPKTEAVRLGDEIGYDYRSCHSVWICEHLLELD